MHLVYAQWVVLGSTYSFMANDYPDLIFVEWNGNTHSTNRAITGIVDDVSYTLIASFRQRPGSPSADPQQYL